MLQGPTLRKLLPTAGPLSLIANLSTARVNNAVRCETHCSLLCVVHGKAACIHVHAQHNQPSLCLHFEFSFVLLLQHWRQTMPNDNTVSTNQDQEQQTSSCMVEQVLNICTQRQPPCTDNNTRLAVVERTKDSHCKCWRRYALCYIYSSTNAVNRRDRLLRSAIRHDTTTTTNSGDDKDAKQHSE